MQKTLSIIIRLLLYVKITKDENKKAWGTMEGYCSLQLQYTYAIAISLSKDMPVIGDTYNILLVHR
jgi:hypothetical protein